MKRILVRSLLFAACLGALSFTGFAQSSASAKPVKKQVVTLKDAKGTDVGTATIKPSGKGVEVKLES